VSGDQQAEDRHHLQREPGEPQTKPPAEAREPSPSRWWFDVASLGAGLRIVVRLYAAGWRPVRAKGEEPCHGAALERVQGHRGGHRDSQCGRQSPGHVHQQLLAQRVGDHHDEPTP
jgi:hypothetical protein